MKKFILFLTILSSVNLYSQHRIAVNKDTVKCKITEVSTDSIFYISNGKSFNIPIKQIKYLEFSSATRQLVRALKAKSIVKTDWFGLDFSYAKICSPGRKNDYMNNFYSDCNDLIFVNKQFDNFKKCIQNFDTTFVGTRNKKINFDCNESHLCIDSITSVIKQIKFNLKVNGVGLIIFVSLINKPNETISFYTVFFDSNKNILLVLKYKEKTSGVGVAWHCIKPVLEILDGHFGIQWNQENIGVFEEHTF
jgi:hypothetical protein